MAIQVDHTSPSLNVLQGNKTSFLDEFLNQIIFEGLRNLGIETVIINYRL